MLYKKIILAVDGSNTSNYALQEAIKLAEDQKAVLLVIHVVEENFGFHGGAGFDYSPLIELYKREGQKILDQAKERISSQSSIKFETKLVQLNSFQGRVAEVIIEETKQSAADLLVIGTHGRRGFNHLILGSVAELAIRIATTPVLLIRHSANS
ncbi:Universal stress protein/MSMEI_3859 [Legionella massiliensis]|uniref:Universal stress protein n=1 Tax=Legionella massiliensis TaxID=1034943 RepID=A0A078L152_9GAMM|nr:universal stress protein [Legionella massiliensis]CDZ77764.1 Universal stress protein/MSMEI_3859 [Legionella massiliensis]CEE13502.1 hypothetical protein BN1094_02054 [Legionella massiliensis]